MLSTETIARYNKIRTNTDKSVLCHAPFVNINFEQNGNMTACCFNREHVLGTYPETTIMEAWTGEKAESLREYILANNLGKGCQGCENHIETGSYHSSRALPFDDYVAPNGVLKRVANIFSPEPASAKNFPAFPKVLELEISNVCNLECDMCDGYFSSSIRKNREKKPPLQNPYDDNFVEQIASLLPHLQEIKFLGGEPFMIDLYYKIWERILEVNPKLRVNITTNGTIMNQRVRDLVQRLNCSVTISLDSLDPGTYEKIRVGAKFNQVMSNLHEFMAILKSKGMPLSIAVCPMNLNWNGLPDIVRFANTNNLHSFYNTVWHPEHSSIHSQKPKELRKIIAFLQQQDFTITSALHKLNISKYNDVIQTFSHWFNEGVTIYGGEIPFLDSEPTEVLQSLPAREPARAIILNVLREQIDVVGTNTHPDIVNLVETELGPFQKSQFSLKTSLTAIADHYSPLDYMLANNEALIAIAKIGFKNKISIPDLINKINTINLHLNDSGSIEVMRNKVIAGHPLKQLLFIDGHSVDAMVSRLD